METLSEHEFDITQYVSILKRAGRDDYYGGMDDAEIAVQLGLEGLYRL